VEWVGVKGHWVGDGGGGGGAAPHSIHMLALTTPILLVGPT